MRLAGHTLAIAVTFSAEAARLHGSLRDGLNFPLPALAGSKSRRWLAEFTPALGTLPLGHRGLMKTGGSDQLTVIF